MSKLSAEAKQAIIDKVLAKDGRTVREIAEAHHIGYSTLQKWLKKIRNDAIIDPTNANKIPLILTFYSCFFISKCYSMKFLSVFYVEFILIMIIKFFIDSNNLNNVGD
jgi:hypothetical protein